MYSALVNGIHMAPGLARTRESERGLFGYTERGFDDENELTQPLELWKGD